MKSTRQRHFTRRACAEIILAALGIICGGALAVIWLFLKPAVVVEHLPAPGQQEREFGQVYYVKGSRDKARGASWIQKRQSLLEAAPAGGTITLNEDELNAWFASSAHIRQIRRKSAGTPARDGDDAPAAAGLADFHIERGALQVSAPVTVRIVFLRADVIVQARGTFARINGVDEFAGTGAATTPNAAIVMFSPAEIYAGSLPLHRIPGAKAFLLREVFANETLPSVGVAAWRRIENVKITGKELQITLSAEP